MERAEINLITEAIIRACFSVHNKLGPGFAEKVYEKALGLELKKHKIGFAAQKNVKLTYDGVDLGYQRLDFLVEDEVVVEIKSCSNLIPLFKSQLLAYLKASEKRAGLLVNFGKNEVEVKRAVNGF